MKIIKSDATYRLYNGDSVQVLDHLPVGFYRVAFNPMNGWSLEQASPLIVGEKMYGNALTKIGKVLHKFENSERNLGVLLSGDKGIGKSMFARQLCVEGVEIGYPVIIIDQAFEQLTSFLSQITQPVFVLFDEFDKVYAGSSFSEDDDGESSNNSMQNSLLSLFDGVYNTKMLFIVTCNDVLSLSDFLLHRPGRFHYHLRFAYPDESEIIEYLSDKLDEKYHDKIPAVVDYGRRINLTYDCLRAIASELNDGLEFDEAVEDLNIEADETEFRCELVYDDGVIFDSSGTFSLDFTDKRHAESIYYDGWFIGQVSFMPSSLKYNAEDHCYYTDECQFKATENMRSKSEQQILTTHKDHPARLRVWKWH